MPEDGAAVDDVHTLLLSLAGQVDDELLGWSRELVAVGESEYALELLTSAVVADGLRLPERVHAALRGSRRAAVELPDPDPAPVMAHRFLADPAAAGYPPAVAEAFRVDALRVLPDRLMRDCRRWLTWRLTPAGSAPTPVPHPVLLIETAEHDGADLLAYQVADLLGRAGVFASVEVFGADTRLGEYHRAALDAARDLDDVAGPAGSAVASLPDGSDGRRPDSVVTPPRGTPAMAREPAPQAPLQPVDRVITARAANQRGPVPDNVTPIERPTQDRAPLERPAPGPESEGGRRPGRDNGRVPRDAQRDTPWAAPRPPERSPDRAPERGDLRGRPSDEPIGPPPVRPGQQPGELFGPADRQPPEHGGPPPGPGDRRPPHARAPGGNGAGDDRNGHRGVDPRVADATRAVPPVPPPPADPRPPRAPSVNRPAGRPRPLGPPPANQPGPNQPPPGNQPPRNQLPGNQPTGWQQPVRHPDQPLPDLPPHSPADLPELPDGLSDVEQRLLRQLHEELAAREDTGLPLADQPPQRMFRNVNGSGGGRPPQRRPFPPPPDQAS